MTAKIDTIAFQFHNVDTDISRERIVCDRRHKRSCHCRKLLVLSVDGEVDYESVDFLLRKVCEAIKWHGFSPCLMVVDGTIIIDGGTVPHIIYKGDETYFHEEAGAICVGLPTLNTETLTTFSTLCAVADAAGLGMIRFV